MIDKKTEKMIKCVDLSHEPPSHIFIPYGQEYIHECPSCGRKVKLKSTNLRY